jgi:hypothetical protein
MGWESKAGRCFILLFCHSFEPFGEFASLVECEVIKHMLFFWLFALRVEVRKAFPNPYLHPSEYSYLH